MNPFGIFDAVSGALDIVLHALGRKSRRETRREHITFVVLYAFLLFLGVGVLAFVVWRLYFQQ